MKSYVPSPDFRETRDRERVLVTEKRSRKKNNINMSKTKARDEQPGPKQAASQELTERMEGVEMNDS